MLKKFAWLIPILLVGLFCAPPAGRAQTSTPGSPAVTPEPFPNSDRYPAEVTLTSPEGLTTLYRLQIDIGDLRTAGGSHAIPAAGEPFEPLIATVYVNPAEVEALAQYGLAAIPIPNLSLRAFKQYGPGSGAPNAWPSFNQFVLRMQGLAATHPDLVRMVSIGKSVNNRDLWCLKITDNPDLEENEPEFRYVSTMHGNEPVGIEMTLRLGELLLSSYGTDPILTNLVNEEEIWLCPIYNPDGYVAGSRGNAHGVDLNRNYPDPITDPVDDPAGRELETQAFMYFGYGHRFTMGANYHTGALVVNYPWDGTGHTPSSSPDNTIFHTNSVGYAIRNPMMYNVEFTEGVTQGWVVVFNLRRTAGLGLLLARRTPCHHRSLRLPVSVSCLQ